MEKLIFDTPGQLGKEAAALAARRLGKAVGERG